MELIIAVVLIGGMGLAIFKVFTSGLWWALTLGCTFVIGVMVGLALKSSSPEPVFPHLKSESRASRAREVPDSWESRE